MYLGMTLGSLEHLWEHTWELRNIEKNNENLVGIMGSKGRKRICRQKDFFHAL